MSEYALGKRRRSSTDSEDDGVVKEFQNLSIPGTYVEDVQHTDDLPSDSDSDNFELLVDMQSTFHDNQTINARDARVNPRGVLLFVRASFNDRYATEAFPIPAHKATTMSDLKDALEEKIPHIAIQHSFDEDKLTRWIITSHVTIPLQETSSKDVVLRRSQYITLGMDGTAAYIKWYQRNVRVGKEDTLKVEIRLRTNGEEGDLELDRQIRAAGLGEATMQRHGYQKARIDDVEVFYSQLSTRENINQQLTSMTESDFLTWFPQRHNPNPKARALTFAEAAAQGEAHRAKQKARKQHQRQQRTKQQKMDENEMELDNMEGND